MPLSFIILICRFNQVKMVKKKKKNLVPACWISGFAGFLHWCWFNPDTIGICDRWSIKSCCGCGSGGGACCPLTTALGQAPALWVLVSKCPWTRQEWTKGEVSLLRTERSLGFRHFLWLVFNRLIRRKNQCIHWRSKLPHWFAQGHKHTPNNARLSCSVCILVCCVSFFCLFVCFPGLGSASQCSCLFVPLSLCV